MTRQLEGKKAIVTAGPTYESIDPVRFIGNHSSGKMGFAIAESLYMKGADVVLITGPSQEKIAYKGITTISVQSANEMYEAVKPFLAKMDIGIFSAAVADYTVKNPSIEKIKKKEASLIVELTKTVDILAEAGKNKQANQLIVGFALETENEIENAKSKLVQKNADIIVLNSLKTVGAGFAVDTNSVIIFSKKGKEQTIELKSKKEVANEIVSFVIQESNAI